MINSIGWGKAANNNTISYGQGAFNNAIGWGYLHYISNSGDTELVGNEGGISYNFSTRISTDTGTYEANSCLITTLNNLDIIL